MTAMLNWIFSAMEAGSSLLGLPSWRMGGGVVGVTMGGGV
jgi:hypothetical protein